MPNIVDLSLNTGNIHLENNLYQDIVISSFSPTGVYPAGTLVGLDGPDFIIALSTADNLVGMLAHELDHTTGTVSASRYLYAGKVRADHVRLGTATSPTVFNTAEIVRLNEQGVYIIELNELNG